MPASTGPNLGLKHGWSNLENGWGPDMNANLKRLDALTQLAVKDKDLNSAPGSPVAGDRYIVGNSPTGAWSGQAKAVAVWMDAAWTFYPPKVGWQAWVEDESVFYVFNGIIWALPA